MTAREIFEALAPLLAPALEQEFDRRDLCILAARVAIEVSDYFGILAKPLPVKVILYNEAFARRVAAGTASGNPVTWDDGSWSVGIGCGKPNEVGRWDGHLIAVGDGCFGDFAIQQAERLQHNIHTGTALVGPYDGAPLWRAIDQNSGTVVEYQRIADDTWRNAPDWKDTSRRRPVVGAMIRAVRAIKETK